MSFSDRQATAVPSRATRHKSFVAYDRFRFLKWAGAVVVFSIVLYIVDRPYGTRYGGTWAGYTLGTLGALLILWLTGFGLHKRGYGHERHRVAARLSAHVYLGLALLVVATLHTGFYFGWNIHTLAYALMCIVIASGVFGTVAYVRYPRLMTENRSGMTAQQMLGRIASLNEELRRSALPLDNRSAAVVERAVESNLIGGSAWQQLRGHYPNCATAAALVEMERVGEVAPELEEAHRRVRVLLTEKSTLLARTRRDVSYKALMDVWLYCHVPFTFALLAALLAHIISVFFLW